MCDDLDNATLDNATFLKAMESLRWANNASGQYSYIDYKNMGTEELGSVYESLLELVPAVDMPARVFRFIGVEDDESTAGNARKTTGSYYTPSFLVDQLVKTALVPVLEKTAKEHVQDKAEALLSLSVIDPACGSGHFILAAARKIAEYVAVARDDDGVVTPSEYRRALRDVISRCIYGVDLNPMAVELTKMALWLEGYEPGKPLSFLDRHLLCGNSLLGVFDLTVLDTGIPKDAFKPLSGDDKEYCANLAKQNAIGLKSYKQELEVPEQTNIVVSGRNEDMFGQVDSMPEESVSDVEQKAREYYKYREQIESKIDYVASDIYIGAFLMQKRPGRVVPTSQTLYRYKILQQPSETDQEAIKEARKACKKANVLHWSFAFPQVFAKGGFDVVLGNPPWEKITIKEQEFFASRNPEIAKAQNAAKRKALIDKLATGSEADKMLYQDFLAEEHQAEALSNFIHVKEEQYGQYPLSGIGDTNLYALFAELVSKLREKNKGRVGIIVPTGIATDDSTKRLFGSFVEDSQLISLYDIENRDKVFPAVDSRQKFSLLTLGFSHSADFACFLHSIQELEDDRRHFELTAEDFNLINPNTHTLPIFRSKMDAELAKKIYRKVPVLIDESKGEEGNPWGVQFSTMFHMSNDSSLFLDSPEADSYPLYEAKMLHQYDHRWATYEPDGTVRDVTIEEKMNPDFEVTPRYWVPKKEVLIRIADVPDSVRKAWYAGEEHQLRMALAACEDEELNQLATADNLMKKMDQVMDQRSPKWLMGWRNITNTTNERTVISSIFPRSAVGHSINLVLLDKRSKLFLANISSIVFDYCARQKVGGTNLSLYYIKQLPTIDSMTVKDLLVEYVNSHVDSLIGVSRLIASSMQIELQNWDFEGRFINRAELDALYARLYGLNRKELMYILDPESVMGKDYPSQTFPGLKNKELREYGEYRTMRLVLEAWDRQERQPELWQ
ncbi:Eco57I restriction-modification methylase domain-containing protein [Sphaerochaeta sp. UBA5849]|uniref:Eco57I restriction-modification methylase domain-containing protein n=1 Tax=Sphaerochaeta sp. UBA5849 TaxID=1947475 RepID=UPI0031F482E3